MRTPPVAVFVVAIAAEHREVLLLASITRQREVAQGEVEHLRRVGVSARVVPFHLQPQEQDP